MKTLARTFSISLLACAAGCLSSPPAAPSVSTCQETGTAFLSFSNQSVTNRTFDVLVDASKLTVVAPGVTTGDFAVPDSVPHAVQFNVSGTSTVACPSTYATVAECSVTTISCKA